MATAVGTRREGAFPTSRIGPRQELQLHYSTISTSQSGLAGLTIRPLVDLTIQPLFGFTIRPLVDFTIRPLFDYSTTIQLHYSTVF